MTTTMETVLLTWMTRFPLDPIETADTDGDGVGDVADAFPDDATETLDFDNDGVGDNSDTDDDNDGVADVDDAFPRDANETQDSDGDRVGDVADAFPQDASETMDADGDGIGDVADTDDDNDGVADVDDLFPNSATKSELSSYRLLPRTGRTSYSCMRTAGDIDGDGMAEFFVGTFATHLDPGTLYVVSGADLSAADESDGNRDFVARVATLPDQPKSWLLDGVIDDFQFGCPPTVFAGTASGDDESLIVVPSEDFVTRDDRQLRYRLMDSGSLGELDSADGTADRQIHFDATLEENQDTYWTILGNGQLGAGIWRVFSYELMRLRTSYTATRLDIDGDGAYEIALSGGGNNVRRTDSGIVSVFSTTDLSTLDASDGTSDRTIQLPTHGSQGWTVIGFGGRTSLMGETIGSGDFNGDGLDELIIGIPFVSGALRFDGIVFVIDGRRISQSIPSAPLLLLDILSWENSWAFSGVFTDDLAGIVRVANVDNDAFADLVVSAPNYWQRRSNGTAHQYSGGVFVVAGQDASSFRKVSGIVGNWVFLENTHPQPNSYLIYGNGLDMLMGDVADVDGDGRDDLLLGAQRDSAYVLSRADFDLADAADGESDGEVHVDNIAAQPNSWQIRAEVGSAVSAVRSAGDLDGDGLGDLLVMEYTDIRWALGLRQFRNGAYILSGADLPHLDEKDGVADGVVHLYDVFGVGQSQTEDTEE